MGKLTDRMIRWWYYFRLGHGTYWSFILAFTQWVVIIYVLAVTRIPALMDIFPEMGLFAVVFLATYIPASIIGGWLHRRYVMKVEAIVGMEMTKPALMISEATLENQISIMNKLGLPVPKKTEEALKWIREGLKR